ncbi:hypothetical protein TSUD_245210 [Trifolium subterraneum]|uniref:Uncharacterized protein n=1 Tax=Trifolium subterraneum TaxID=3900 RepID=A0A2Z6NIF9_TRISU|nr:hypothetical protein TSUD_245210 [Trifolium subterraneum]
MDNIDSVGCTYNLETSVPVMLECDFAQCSWWKFLIGSKLNFGKKHRVKKTLAFGLAYDFVVNVEGQRRQDL